MDTDSERASHNKCFALPYLLLDRIQQAFTQIFFFSPSKINGRHYRDLCHIELGGNTSVKLKAFLLQSQIIGLYCKFVAVQTAQVIISSAAFYKRDLVSILNV